jgi:hypothetical protein
MLISQHMARLAGARGVVIARVEIGQYEIGSFLQPFSHGSLASVPLPAGRRPHAACGHFSPISSAIPATAYF